MNRLAIRILLLTLLVACRTSSPSSSSTSSPDAGVHRGAFMVPVFAGDVAIAPPGTQNPITIKDSSSIARSSFELGHGKITAGGGGSDYKTTIGPTVGSETTGSALWLLPNATAASGTNTAASTDATNLYLNTIGAAGAVTFYNAGTNNIAKLATLSGTQDALWLGHAAAFASTDFAVAADASSFVAINVPTNGIIEFVENNANLRAKFDMAAHGNLTVGGAGTDASTIIGTRVSGATLPTIYLLNNGVSATTGNWAFQGDGTNLFLNTVAGGGTPFFSFNAGGTQFSKFGIFSGSTAALWMGNAAGPTGSNFVLASDESSFTEFNGPPGGLLQFTLGGQNYLNMVAGTQNGVVLGSVAATNGALRFVSGFGALARNQGNTANNVVFQDDGTNNISFGTNYGTVTVNPSTSFTVATPTNIILEATADFYIDANPLRIRSAAHAEYFTITPAAGALFQWNATNATSGTISWTAAAAAAGNTTTISGQNAGATANNGGAVNINGGTQTTTGLGGLVQLQSAGTTMLGIGNYGVALATTSVALTGGGNVTLTSAQYQVPYIVLTGAIGGGAATVTLPNNPGTWQFDCSQVSGASTIAWKSGSATSATITTPVGGTQQIVFVSTLRGSNTIAINL